MRGQIAAVTLVQGKQQLGVTLRVKRMFGECFPKLTIAIDLSVEDHSRATTPAQHRLMSTLEIDDAQAGVAERAVCKKVRAIIVRPAVFQGSHHALEIRRETAGGWGDDSGYSAHRFDCMTGAKTLFKAPRKQR
jgi:hypothetical protein